MSCKSVPRVNSTQGVNPSKNPNWSVGYLMPQAGAYVGYWYPEQKGFYDVSVMLAEPGGLLGSYYDNVWFLNTPTFTRVDAQVPPSSRRLFVLRQ